MSDWLRNRAGEREDSQRRVPSLLWSLTAMSPIRSARACASGRGQNAGGTSARGGATRKKGTTSAQVSLTLPLRSRIATRLQPGILAMGGLASGSARG